MTTNFDVLSGAEPFQAEGGRNHVATLDNDQQRIIEETMAFFKKQEEFFT